MENNFLQKQINEGWERLKMLGVLGQVSKDFKVSHKVYYSERQNNFFCAVLYWLDNNEEWVDLVNKFEEKTNNLVYHAQFTRTSYGDMLSLFFVSSEEEEWEQSDVVECDRMEIEERSPITGEHRGDALNVAITINKQRIDCHIKE